MTDYAQEQEMEIEALEAILMDEFKEIHSGESGLSTSNKCFQIKVSAQDDDTDETMTNPVQLALIFSHTEKYPDELPLLNLKSLQGISSEDLRILKEKLQEEVVFNLRQCETNVSGFAAMTVLNVFQIGRLFNNCILITSAKEWLSERFCQNNTTGDTEAEQAAKDDILVPHGEPVTVDTFLAWRERFEAELALQRAKLMPDSALTAPKEKRLTGRQWFESGRASTKGAAPVIEGSAEEDEDDIDFDDDDLEDDEDDMLEHYLAEKSDSSAHSSRRGS